MALSRVRLLIAAGLTCSLYLAARAADGPKADPPAAGPLRGQPSRPGPHLDKVRALGDGGWAALGPPAADPAWGRARGRSWCAAMPFAPDLGGAFLYGEGVHGYAKPDGRYMDDLWFYDANAHRWVCCYPGADTKTLDLTVNADGFEATRGGDLVPVAQQVHGYSMNTYDTDRRRFLSMPNTHEYWKAALPQREKWLKRPPADAGPWAFDVLSGRWDRRRTGAPAPSSGYGDTFVYLPDRGLAFFAHRSRDVWLYDPAAGRWSHPKPEGPEPPFGIDATSCYDPKRGRVYVGGGSYPVAPAAGHAFWFYDLNARRWVDPKPKGKPCRGSNSYNTLNALMAYDAVNDKVLVVLHSAHYDKPDNLGVYEYDPAANAWDETPRPLPAGLHPKQVKNGFYHPGLNAVFLHAAGDSKDNGAVWAYRHKAAADGR